MPQYDHGDKMYREVIRRRGLRAYQAKKTLFRQDRGRFGSLIGE